MKISVLSAIATILSDLDFENKETIMDAIYTDLNRNEAVKAAKAKVYADNWDAVRDVLAIAPQGATVAEIFDSLEGKVGSDFTKGKLTYALGHQWADRVVKTEGKVNTYALKA